MSHVPDIHHCAFFWYIISLPLFFSFDIGGQDPQQHPTPNNHLWPYHLNQSLPSPSSPMTAQTPTQAKAASRWSLDHMPGMSTTLTPIHTEQMQQEEQAFPTFTWLRLYREGGWVDWWVNQISRTWVTTVYVLFSASRELYILDMNTVLSLKCIT